MSASGQGLVLTLHLSNVQCREPPATRVIQVSPAMGMSLAAEGDCDECGEICMISTFCRKLGMSHVVRLLHPVLEVFARPSLLPAGRGGFMTLAEYHIFKGSSLFGQPVCLSSPGLAVAANRACSNRKKT